MSVLGSVLAIAIAGGVGGVLNALMTDNVFGIIKKDWEGWLAALGINVVIGAVAAAVSWALYGPLAAYPVLGPAPGGGGSVATLTTLAALAGALLVGIGGTRWLQGEVDKRVLTEAAATAAQKSADPATAAQMIGASPVKVRNLANALPNI